MQLSDILPLLSTATLVAAGVIRPYANLEIRQSSYSCQGKSYQQIMLDSFNIHRSNHSAPNLVWNDTLATAATNTAQYGVVGSHDADGKGWGQNLYEAYSTDQADPMLQPTAAIDSWYNGEFSNYDTYGDDAVLLDYPNVLQPDPAAPGAVFGHFTQVVWKDTLTVGCATASRPSGDFYGAYTVCDFYPPGNWVTDPDSYEDNVLPPLGNPVIGNFCPSGTS